MCLMSLYKRFSQFIFGLFLLCSVVVEYILCRFVQLYPFWNSKQKQARCARIVGFCLRVCFTLHPFIQVRAAQNWRELPKCACVVMNHSSFLDGLVVAGLIPQYVIGRSRALLKAGLLNLPLFGTVCKMIGHFPVHFSSSKLGDFSVDKDKQAKVMADVHTHVQGGGVLFLFPEGQVNPKPPALQTFRRGAFGVVIEQQTPLWGLAIKGSEEVWPFGLPFGGYPGSIEMSLFPIASAEEVKSMEVAVLCDTAQAKMQQELNRLYNVTSSPPSATSASSSSDGAAVSPLSPVKSTKKVVSPPQTPQADSTPDKKASKKKSGKQKDQ